MVADNSGRWVGGVVWQLCEERPQISDDQFSSMVMKAKDELREKQRLMQLSQQQQQQLPQQVTQVFSHFNDGMTSFLALYGPESIVEISPPRFLAECRMRRLNQASFVLLCFALFAFSGMSLVFVVTVLDLSSVL